MRNTTSVNLPKAAVKDSFLSPQTGAECREKQRNVFTRGFSFNEPKQKDQCRAQHPLKGERTLKSRTLLGCVFNKCVPVFMLQTEPAGKMGRVAGVNDQRVKHCIFTGLLCPHLY
ncbi:hypothetical protein XENOCAPTIV_003718 [Xenoophorus captivus]|uniref:Uncharacterized protein n=1 Tax=Xenoophorus captivus TaxID=1517983 RepID=A0ABV0QL55_9TELE